MADGWEVYTVSDLTLLHAVYQPKHLHLLRSVIMRACMQPAHILDDKADVSVVRPHWADARIDEAVRGVRTLVVGADTEGEGGERRHGVRPGGEGGWRTGG